MSRLDSTPWRIVQTTQRRWDRFKLEMKRRLDRFDALVLLAYRSHGGSGRIRVRGRLVEEKGVEPPPEDGSVLRNALNTIHRFESDEIPDALVVARLRDATVQGRTDPEGFFDLVMQPESELEPGWHEVEIELLDSMAGAAGTTSTAEVLVPSPDAGFAVVSDVDDTVLETRATDLLTEIRLVFSRSASERSAMPGAAPLYEALEAGPDGDASNPFFYVSMSGWGLYDLMAEFLDTNGFPKGPIYLQDIAILEPKSPELGSENHKRDTIGRLLEDYPDLPFVLIGDSGKQDPETYRDIVERHADRIRAVLIRAVTPPDRDSEVRAIVRDIIDMGVPAAAAESSVSLARAAADFGLVPDEAIADVREGMVQKREE